MPNQEQPVQVGRLALRVEGDFWVAYFAARDTMEGAIVLGSVRLAVIEERPDRIEGFRLFIQEVYGDLVENLVGERPTWPNPPVPAPEHERAGNA